MYVSGCVMFTMSQIQFISDLKWRPGASTDELCLKEMTNFTKSGRFSPRHVELCHYCLSHLLFPPSVCRASHICPVATASGTAFWVLFEHTSVSSVQMSLRCQKYLWIPFDIFAYNTHSLFFSLSSALKTEDGGLTF